MNTTLAGLAAAATALVATAASAQMQNPTVGGAEMFADKTIVENAVNSPINTTLVAAVQAADLVDTLSGPGPFTVFAPTNAAFERIRDADLNDMLKPENKAFLQQVLTCHVVSGEVMADAIAGMIASSGGSHPVETLGGCTLNASRDGNRIMLTDENGRVANVEIADVDQSNGVIHVIDRVLLPKQ
ncbi:fasciclin domain-containing protein [Jannaschia sp. W003]|uniref:fasciclin domain-containing protein n=1 Tax=Jannaschia sp. W003 TaxID=2867012 RepID=UPI0021A5147A|nr:fasciclin domain-containing protein [Jannaschia sp. W003]UWQ21067.1 fasciclin domain-containing protein [Jannaschia sp. W003]